MVRIVTKKGFLNFITVLAVLGLIGWGLLSWFAPTAHVRYRLDVTLEVDGEPVTGSVVQELTVNHGLIRGLSGKLITRTVRGQALALDLPGRGTLFVTMALYCPGKTEWGQCKYGYAYLVDEACAIKKQQPNFAVFVRRFKRLDGSCPITEDQLPVMVRFEDPQRSETVQQVLPQDLAKTFGPDVRFLSAGLTFTNAPLTTGIDHRLPWLSKHPDRALIPYDRALVGSFALSLRHVNFKE